MVSLKKIMYKILNGELMYPVGSVYISVNAEFDPNNYWKGTTWTRIEDDVYLKNMTTSIGVGSLGGTSSEHKIPISSMPEHQHGLIGVQSSWADRYMALGGNSTSAVCHTSTLTTGGGQAYYPYYLGCYMWKRTA